MHCNIPVSGMTYETVMDCYALEISNKIVSVKLPIMASRVGPCLLDVML